MSARRVNPVIPAQAGIQEALRPRLPADDATNGSVDVPGADMVRLIP